MYKITLKIDGMMCGMCESHMNDAIRRTFRVKKISSSHKKGETEIVSEQHISEDAIRGAVSDTGYILLSYKCEPYEKKGFFASLFTK